MAFYLLQESGFKITLEDGTGFILLEEEAPPPPNLDRLFIDLDTGHLIYRLTP